MHVIALARVLTHLHVLVRVRVHDMTSHTPLDHKLCTRYCTRTRIRTRTRTQTQKQHVHVNKT